MATVIPIGEPVNEAERRTIRHLRDRLPEGYQWPSRQASMWPRCASRTSVPSQTSGYSILNKTPIFYKANRKR